ncbi:MAG: uracil-DNA glycosylase [Candidatus Sericytochromatia bacterium]
MDSYQLSLFSGDVPDENINKKLDTTKKSSDSTNTANNLNSIDTKKEEVILKNKEIENKSFEDLEIEKIYNNFKKLETPSRNDKELFLSELKKIASNCKKCPLYQTKTNIVFSDGDFEAPILLVGEGPGENEDKTGIPFVGKAGQLLDKILESGGFKRENDFYIINAVKCRPPQNRTPTPEEIDACYPFLEKQMEISEAQIVLLSGATAMKAVLKINAGITKMRGEWIEKNGKYLMPIFHPSYLLRNTSKDVGSPKWLMWQDIKKIAQKNKILNSNEEDSN